MSFLKRNTIAEASTSGNDPEDRGIWDAIWKAKIPNKVKFFGWRVATKTLATKQNACRRTMAIDSVCDICGTAPEDEFHAVIACTRSKALRHEMRRHWELPREGDIWDTGPDWLQLLLLANTEAVRRNTLLLLWQAWNLRNNVVHGDGKERVAGAVLALIRLQEDLGIAESGQGDDKNINKLSVFPTVPQISAHPTPDHWEAPLWV